MGLFFRGRLGIFLTGFIQVALVAANTVQIAKESYVAATIIGFMISLVWSFNVKKVAFGSIYDRIVYSLGAASGTLTGMYVSGLIE